IGAGTLHEEHSDLLETVHRMQPEAHAVGGGQIEIRRVVADEEPSEIARVGHALPSRLRGARRASRARVVGFFLSRGAAGYGTEEAHKKSEKRDLEASHGRVLPR